MVTELEFEAFVIDGEPFGLGVEPFWVVVVAECASSAAVDGPARDRCLAGPRARFMGALLPTALA